MCKVFIMTNMTQITNINETTNVIAKLLTETELDGFGYTIQGELGLYGERTLDTKQFKASMRKPILQDKFVLHDYNRFGKKSEIVGGGIFHGRTSTNDTNLLNTHPINKGGWSLIHNGVVTDHGPKYKMTTTNDTEHVLHRLMIGGIDAVAQHLTGYYAVGAFDPQGQLHVFKDSTARLYCAHIEALNTYVFATTKDLITEAAADLDWKISVISPVKDDTYLVFKDGKVMQHREFTSLGFGYKESKHAERSLGYSLDKNWPAAHQMIQGVPDESNDVGMTLSASEAAFLEEVNKGSDHTYTFLDYRHESMTLMEFKALSDEQKLYCTVIRPDGTLVDQVDYTSDKLFEGPIKGAM